MKQFFFCLLLLWAQMTLAQSSIEWQNRYGGTGSDGISAIEQTADGGYIAIGNSWSDDGNVTGHHGANQKYDVWVIKLNAQGGLEWEKSYGGTDWDYGFDIHQTHDGNYVFIGLTQSSDGDVSNALDGFQSAWVVKLGSTGNIIWEKTFGTNDSSGKKIVELENGEYVAAGTDAGAYWLLQIDPSGDKIIWEKHFGGSSQEALSSMARTADKGFILAGSSWSDDGDVTGHHGPGTAYSDYWVVKVDSLGQMEWEKSLGGTNPEQSDNIIATSDGGSLLTGFSYSNDGDVSGLHIGSGNASEEFDPWIVKIDAQGNLMWQRMLGGSNTENLGSVCETTDGNVVVAGYTSSTDGDVDASQFRGYGDCWIITLNAAGGIVSQVLMGGSEFDQINAIYSTSDGGLVFGGYAGSSDGDVTTPPLSGFDDYWILKLGALSAVDDLQSHPLKITPNPVRGVFNLESPADDPFTHISVTDALGRRVLEQAYNPGQAVDLGDAPAGMYQVIATAQSGKKSVSKLVRE